jgi:Spy/CpxP family protein refolding chaperone
MIKTQSSSLKLLFTGMLVAVMATVAMTGWAQPRHGEGRGGPPMGGPGMFLMGPPERIDRAVDRLLDGVDATDAQRKQVKAIAQAAAKDTRDQMDSGRELHEKMRALLVAPTVDDAAIESVRQQIARQHEAASQRLTKAVVEAAKVLTPKQREQLAQRFEKRRGHFRGREQGALPTAIPMT